MGGKNARHVSRLHEVCSHEGEKPVRVLSVFFPMPKRRESDGGNAGTVGGLNAARERDRGRCKDIRPPGTMSAINAARRPFDVNQTAGEYAPLPHWPRLPFVAL